MAKIMRHKFGTPAYPIPITDKLTGETVWLADEQNAVYIPTMRDEPKDRIYGRLIRQVVTDPSMMKDMTEMLLRLDKSRTPKESKSYGYTTMGAPGNGKTYLAKAIGELVHPKGAIVVDCNNIDNPDELFKVTTFSVDQTRKQRKVDAAIRMGNHDPENPFSQNAVAYMKKMFGNDIVTQETRDGRRITAVDWNAIKQDPSYVEAVLDKVMEIADIPYEKETSSLGFVVSNGPLLQALMDEESPDYGRMVIRDETNRGPVVDAWLKIQAFFSEPGADELKLKGEDDREVVIKRSEIPDTFMFLGTANSATEEMGLSAKEMTKPMISREGMGIDIRQISDPEKADFISRTLKHLTGVPAYHVYMMDADYYDNHPEELSKTLMHLRTIGLTATEKRQIPQEEKFNIEHIDRTIHVAVQYGSLIAEAEQLVRKAIKDDSLPVAYTEYLKNQVVLDLRYVYKLYQHSKINHPISKTKGRNLFQGLGSTETAQTQEEIAYEMNKRIANRERNNLLNRGTRLENEVAAKLHDMIIPDSINYMLKDSETPKEDYTKIEGLWNSLKHVAKSLKFEYAGYVGVDSVAGSYNALPEELPGFATKEIKTILTQSINQIYEETLSPDDIFDEETLSEAIELMAKDEDKSYMLVPNLDIATTPEKPLLKKYLTRDAVYRKDLITTEQFVHSLIHKNMRKYNIRKYAMQKPVLERCYGNEISRRIAMGEDDVFFTTTVCVNNEKKNDADIDTIGVASIIYVKVTDEMLILANFDIDKQTTRRLKENGVVFLGNVLKDYDRDSRDKAEVYVGGKVSRYGGEIKVSDVVSSLMLRLDRELADGGTIFDYCGYVSCMFLPNDKTLRRFVSLTNVEYKESNVNQDIITALNAHKNGR